MCAINRRGEHKVFSCNDEGLYLLFGEIVIDFQAAII
jgi:hypothetical protein